MRGRQATVIVHVERIPADGLNAYLWHRRLGATCRNGLAHSGYRHLADKDEVPGSSPGRPTTPASQVRALPSASAPARCRLGPRWGRTPIPAGTSPGPSGSAHPAVRLGDDHTAWSSTQPEDGSHAAAAATSRCSLHPGPPRSRPRRALRTPAWPAWSLGGQARPPRPAPNPAARVATDLPPTNATSAASPASRPPRPSSSRRRPGSHRGLHPSRWSGSPGHLDLVPTATA
jgi:hypothetical protein